MEANHKWGVLFIPSHRIGRRPAKRRDRIEKTLQESGVEFDLVQSENQKSVPRIIDQFIRGGCDSIIVVGGDSALNDAVNCLMALPEEDRRRMAVGLIPNGVMNDFAHFWEIDGDDLEGTLKMILRRRLRKIDLGCIHYTNADGVRCHRHFANCVNVGLLAAVQNMRMETRRWFGSRTLSMLLSCVFMLFQRLEYKMHLKINTDTVNRSVMTLCIGNSKGYGQTPNAVPYNGQLDVSVNYSNDLVQMLEGFYLLFTGKILNHKSVHPYRTQRVEVLKAERASITVDGRTMKRPVGQFHVDIEPEVVSFIIP